MSCCRSATFSSRSCADVLNSEATTVNIVSRCCCNEQRNRWKAIKSNHCRSIRIFWRDTYLRAFFLPRHRLALESVALRQQLAVFKRKQPRPRLNRLDRLFWIALRHWYSGWADALILVKPETVVSWHRADFRLFWRWKSRPAGRRRVSAEIRFLIRKMKNENPIWGAPRIHGELLQLGVGSQNSTTKQNQYFSLGFATLVKSVSFADLPCCTAT